jgi:murein DD-endopeptidase MepM/ murein hydrolase activator NlpD
MNNLVHVFSDSLEKKTERPKKDTTGKYQKVNTRPSQNDLQFRKDVENEPASLKFAGATMRKNVLANYLFFSPVKGMVTSSFNSVDEHYGVDVAAKKDEFIKSTLDGTIVFAGFTSGDGYVVEVQHENNLMSIYKHNSQILKKAGDKVKSGEPIAVIGNTGESSKGPHLHFELWHNGLPINPEEFIIF